jgi:acetylornithine/N-succinyldiaminopimelate aminotransferase
LQALQQKCKEKEVLLIVDEIQSGFGRTGTLWAFEQFDIVPDIFLLGKALGGGMPLGAFIADKKIMSALTHDPVLGHITTFGGHPVSCAAGKAALEVLLESNLINEVKEKEQLLLNELKHPLIQQLRSAGLWLAVEFEQGIITDWFLFASNCLRIAPPLIINKEELHSFSRKFLSILDLVQQN